MILQSTAKVDYVALKLGEIFELTEKERFSLLAFSIIAKYILHHHERWDGTGYPNGLKGEETPLFSRIIAIVDAYDVMTHARPFSEPLSQAEDFKSVIWIPVKKR
jgi:HD-GYP domain-containing protein (c-di-GMP phosphodiesterase class II)